MAQKQINWFAKNCISLILFISMLTIICFIISIIFYQQKLALTLGLDLPLTLIVLGMTGWVTLMSLKNYEWDWYDKGLYMNLSFVLYLILSVIGFGLYSFTWSNLFLLIVNGLYFIFIGSSFNFYNKQIDLYFNGANNA